MSRWSTVGFAVLAVVLGFVAAVGALVALRIMMPAFKPGRADGTTVAVLLLVSNLVQGVTIMLASRLSGTNVLAYLGLDIPRRRQIVVSMAALAVWLVFVVALTLTVSDFVLETKGRQMIELFRSARADGSLIWLLLGIVVAAPIGEELLFRGFMLRGFIHATRDAIPSVVLTSIIWSLLHLDYGWSKIPAVFVFGVLLGWIRWSTGSTTLTILLHMVGNLLAFMWTLFAIEFASD
jgi:membrane protease YdiL (CAAX protease family)